MAICKKCNSHYLDFGFHECSKKSFVQLYEPPKVKLPIYKPVKFEPPKPASRDLYYDDRSRWNTLYGYHHTMGPGFGPKA